MVKKELKSKLHSLGVEELSRILLKHAEVDHRLANALEMTFGSKEPKKLAKQIKAKITSIRKNTRFVMRKEAYEFSTELQQIIDLIQKKLLTNDPKLACELLEYFINSAEHIYNRVDDSDGGIAPVFHEALQLWGDSWARVQNKDLDKLVSTISVHLLNNNYGEKDGLIIAMKNALGQQGLALLEGIIVTNKQKYETEYSTINGLLQEIADAKNDVDQFINIVMSQKVLYLQDVINVATRLIDNARAREAIKWLLTRPNNISSSENNKSCNFTLLEPGKYKELTRYNLLLKAYDAEKYYCEARSLRWELFKLTIDEGYFKSLTNSLTPQECEKLKRQAIEVAINQLSTKWAIAVEFLSSLGEYEIINNAILTQHDVISDHDYHLYRPLSKNLATQGYYLSACLLRRKLVYNILNKGQSKYYKYAISDFNLAEKYAKKVLDWQKLVLSQSGYVKNEPIFLKFLPKYITLCSYFRNTDKFLNFRYKTTTMFS